MKRAILLAGGIGSRLRPITLITPKCLVPIRGKPLLEIWLENLTKFGYQEFLINTHYLSEQVEDFIKKSPYRKNVKLVHEPILLGTAGTLRENISFFQGEDGILLHADNYCLANFIDFEETHKNRPKDCEITMMTFHATQPRLCGVVELDERGVVIDFHEKVESPPTNLANGAIYYLSSKFMLEFTKKFKEISCFSSGVLPKMMGQIHTYNTKSILIDIGSIDAYNEVNK